VPHGDGTRIELQAVEPRLRAGERRTLYVEHNPTL
jgi:hypothetical protein